MYVASIFSVTYAERGYQVEENLRAVQEEMDETYICFALDAKRLMSTKENLHMVQKISRLLCDSFVKMWKKRMQNCIVLQTVQTIVYLTSVFSSLCTGAVQIYFVSYQGSMEFRHH